MANQGGRVLKGCSAPMVDVSTHDFKPLRDNKVKKEEYYINTYVNKCLKYDGTISSKCRIHRILEAKYKKVDLNKVMDEQCQHLNPNEQERLLHILEKLKACSMEHWVRGKPLR